MTTQPENKQVAQRVTVQLDVVKLSGKITRTTMAEGKRSTRLSFTVEERLTDDIEDQLISLAAHGVSLTITGIQYVLMPVAGAPLPGLDAAPSGAPGTDAVAVVKHDIAGPVNATKPPDGPGDAQMPGFRCPDHPEAPVNLSYPAACRKCGQRLEGEPGVRLKFDTEQPIGIRCEAHPDSTPWRVARDKPWRCRKCKKNIEVMENEPAGAPA